jgi:hypothetical protein
MNAPSQPAQMAQAIAAAASESAAAAPPDGTVPLAAAVAAEAGPETTGQQRTVEAVTLEATGVKTPSAVPAAAPKLAFWEQAPNLVLLLVLMYLAIGAVCEISSRNEDYGRVSAHYKWLLSCLNGGSDKGCPSGTKLNDDIEVAVTQVRRYDSLNTVGVGSKCLTAPVIAAPLPGFYESCVALISMPPAEVEPARKALLTPVLSSPWWSVKTAPLQFDQHPKDHLYFFLVLVSSAIGSLIGGLRVAGITTLKDLALGLGAGFAVYMLLRSGSFVSLATPLNVDILNPFSAGAVGMMVGLFSDKAFTLVDSVFGSKLKPPTAEADKVTVGAARMTSSPIAAH